MIIAIAMRAFAMRAFGVYFTLVGLGKVAVSKCAEKNAEWVAKYGTFFKVGGPIMLVCGAVMLLA